MARQFNLFYSWQSDLPKNETRWFLQKCIDDAVSFCRDVMAGTEVTADKDTQGRTGSMKWGAMTSTGGACGPPWCPTI